MSIEIITLLMFGTLLVLIFSGLPIAWCLGATAVIFSLTLWGPSSLPILATRVFDQSMNYVLIAVPLFILMAFCLEESGMAEDLFSALYIWSGKLRGGLAYATVVICVILAACTGIAATATVAMAVIALPRMLALGYNKRMSLGLIGASGGLGILIPPSVPMVILALAGGQSLGKLFMGGIVAGVTLGILFIVYIFIMTRLKPEYCPAAPVSSSWAEKLKAVKALIAPFVLIFIVLGFIMIGVTTPTEAAAVGGIGAFLYMLIKKGINKEMIKKVFHNTAQLSGMVFWIIFGAACFTAVFNALGSQNLVSSILLGLDLSPWAIILLFFAILFLLGMVLDPIGIIMIAGPVMSPLVVTLGYDPTWFGVIFIIFIQLGYITPPFGYNLFYLKAANPDLPMREIFIGVIPFIAVMLFAVTLMSIFPRIILWLPSIVIK